ncbi:amidohydrolase family protein [Alcaligenaceae bacterium]|nr:amidohydrolase family protein [Alcaligenaceae bacterium]
MIIDDPSIIDPPPDSDPRPPSLYALPPGAVDTHAHVIGTHYIEERSYTPHPAAPESYVRMLDASGMAHGVLIQVSVHGTDNSLMLDTLARHPQRLRGIAVAPHDLPAHQWQALKDGGVVGLRLNATTGGGVGVSKLREYEAICAELGWHLQFLIHGHELPALAPQVGRLKVPVIFDHMGYVTPELAGAEAGNALIGLVRDGAWVKLSGAFRISSEGPPYADTTSFASRLAETAPDRCVWGSDWPHVGFRGRMPNVGDLLDLLAAWVPDPARRNAVLAANPQRLYGFPPASDA